MAIVRQRPQATESRTREQDRHPHSGVRETECVGREEERRNQSLGRRGAGGTGERETVRHPNLQADFGAQRVQKQARSQQSRVRQLQDQNPETDERKHKSRRRGQSFPIKPKTLSRHDEQAAEWVQNCLWRKWRNEKKDSRTSKFES